jgi:hypothetical protein
MATIFVQFGKNNNNNNNNNNNEYETSAATNCVQFGFQRAQFGCLVLRTSKPSRKTKRGVRLLFNQSKRLCGIVAFTHYNSFGDLPRSPPPPPLSRNPIDLAERF